MKAAPFLESYLSHFWFNHPGIEGSYNTAESKRLNILSRGKLNRNAGPDIHLIDIEIDGNRLIGNAEIHVRSSDWLRHQHQNDEVYSSIVLHIVFNNDVELGLSCPTLCLNAYFSKELIYKYSQNSFASFIELKSQKFNLLKHKWLKQRLERKHLEFLLFLNQSRNSLDDTFYWMLARNYGFHVNSFPFELLAKSVPLRVVRSLNQRTEELASIFLGQSGLLYKLNHISKTYIKEYEVKKMKYNLSPMKPQLWKRMRMRPHNFPEKRIVQFVNHIASNSYSLNYLLSSSIQFPFEEFFSIEEQSSTQLPFAIKPLSEMSRNNIIINTLVPFYYSYGILRSRKEYTERAIHLLEIMPSENNYLTRLAEEKGLLIKSAYDSQAVLSYMS